MKGGFTVFGNGIDASGGYKADVRTADGHRYSVNMSGDQAKTFENSYAERMSQSDRTGKSHVLSYDDSNTLRAETAASETQRKADNYTHAASRVQEVRDNINESQARSNHMGVNQETQFAKWWADKYQGGQGVQQTMNALEEMKQMEADPAKTKEFQNRQKQFLQETDQIVTSGSIPAHLPGFPSNILGTVENALTNGSAAISSGAQGIESPTGVPSNIRETVQQTNPPKVVNGGHVTNPAEINAGRAAVNNAGKNLSVTPMGTAADKILTPFGQGEAPTAQGVIDGKQYSGMSSEERLVNNIGNLPGAVANGAGAAANAAFPITNGKPIDGAQVIEETVRGNMGLNDQPENKRILPNTGNITTKPETGSSSISPVVGGSDKPRPGGHQ